MKTAFTIFVIFIVGVCCGGYLFSQSIPRKFLSFEECPNNKCFDSKELAGLLVSAAIQKVPGLIPGVVLESDTCLAVRYPKPEAKVHYVLFPKHDIKNITSLAPEDAGYVMGCFALARQLVEREHMQAYRVSTNGPAYQEIAYLHFHLVGR
jgi:diadenosine tetraphosphate (Ap4A) HIT family hydrolase